ncbi:MAG TPA: MOSC domain-containing protein [Gaiellaceae bacterium]|nr:MOSC domain-containing protein [Gaiellaceae bacterium]
MEVVSVNAGRAERLQIAGRTITTGIRKSAVARAQVGPLGLAGDVVANTKHHGGPDQALYLYSAEDYAWWAAELGAAPNPGTFGENLTLSSFGPDEVRIGDRYRAGSALLEATSPRIPCSTFATRMGVPGWVKRFAAARRPGLYVRVLEPGEVGAGDPVERIGGGEEHPTVVELMDAWYDAEPDAKLLERLLAAPVAGRARARLEQKLARA